MFLNPKEAALMAWWDDESRWMMIRLHTLPNVVSGGTLMITTKTSAKTLGMYDSP
jgi:hypothetical protein